MSSYIKQIQTTLKNAGFYTGEIDGIAGKMTVQAVQSAIYAIPPKSEPTQTLNPQANPNTQPTSGFVLTETSLKKLDGVNPNLVAVVKRAIEISSIDFRVSEGLRTKERQAELVRQGASQTMNSRHIGGFAVDLVAIIDGQVSWDFNHYYTIAKAMAQASTELGVKVRWGGAWTVITGKDGTPQDWVKAYKTAQKNNRKKAFLDGVHFELPV